MLARVTCAVDGEAMQRIFRLLRVSPADEVHKAHVPLQRTLLVRLGLDKRGCITSDLGGEAGEYARNHGRKPALF
jgi:hypothetical protein